MLPAARPAVLADALAEKRRDGGRGDARVAWSAAGEGWRIFDVVCTAGPDDRPYEEAHERVSLSFVLEGGFAYRSDLGRAIMTPGAVLLGDAGACFRCGHEHGEGDRCLSFQFDRALVERAAADLGVRFRGFGSPRLALSARAPRICQAVLIAAPCAREEAAFTALAEVLPHALQADRPPAATPRDERRALDLARDLDDRFLEPASLRRLADRAGLSRFHLLRLFKRVTGATPHQYLLRRRLDWAAALLLDSSAAVTAIAFDSGFEDLSNFNRSFRAAYGASPGAWRRRRGRSGPAGSPA